MQKIPAKYSIFFLHMLFRNNVNNANTCVVDVRRLIAISCPRPIGNTCTLWI